MKKTSAEKGGAGDSSKLAVLHDSLLIWLHDNSDAVATNLIGWSPRWKPGALENVLKYSGDEDARRTIASAPPPDEIATRLHLDFPVLQVTDRDPFDHRSKPKATLITRADAMLVAVTNRPDFDSEEKKWSIKGYIKFRWFVLIDPELKLIQETMKRVRPILEAHGFYSVLVVTTNGERAALLSNQGVDVVVVPNPNQVDFELCSGSWISEKWEEASKCPVESKWEDRFAGIRDSYPRDAQMTLVW